MKTRCGHKKTSWKNAALFWAHAECVFCQSYPSKRAWWCDICVWWRDVPKQESVTEGQENVRNRQGPHIYIYTYCIYVYVYIYILYICIYIYTYTYIYCVCVCARAGTWWSCMYVSTYYELNQPKRRAGSWWSRVHNCRLSSLRPRSLVSRSLLPISRSLFLIAADCLHCAPGLSSFMCWYI